MLTGLQRNIRVALRTRSRLSCRGDLGRLDRRKARFEERFSADRMARAYESAYRGLISAAAKHSAAAPDDRRLETKLTDELPPSNKDFSAIP
jgi:hypothetical protein